MFASPEDLALGPSLLLTLWVALSKSLSFSGIPQLFSGSPTWVGGLCQQLGNSCWIPSRNLAPPRRGWKAGWVGSGSGSPRADLPTGALDGMAKKLANYSFSVAATVPIAVTAGTVTTCDGFPRTILVLACLRVTEGSWAAGTI